MKRFNQSLLGGALVLATGLAQAEVTANIAAVSDYLFRGVNQTNGAAIQGGLDYGNDSGFYAGTWISNVNFSSNNDDTGEASIGRADSEVDLYAGFGGEAGSIGYDLGVLYYWYPGAGGDAQNGDADYAEITLGLSAGMFSANLAYTAWAENDADDTPFLEGDLYYSISADLPMSDGFGLGLTIGKYDFDEADSYKHGAASLSKDVGDFGSMSVNLEQNDADGDEAPQVWLGWSKEF